MGQSLGSNIPQVSHVARVCSVRNTLPGLWHFDLHCVDVCMIHLDLYTLCRCVHDSPNWGERDQAPRCSQRAPCCLCKSHVRTPRTTRKRKAGLITSVRSGARSRNCAAALRETASCRDNPPGRWFLRGPTHGHPAAETGIRDRQARLQEASIILLKLWNCPWEIPFLAGKAKRSRFIISHHSLLQFGCGLAVIFRSYLYTRGALQFFFSNTRQIRVNETKQAAKKTTHQNNTKNKTKTCKHKQLHSYAHAYTGYVRAHYIVGTCGIAAKGYNDSWGWVMKNNFLDLARRTQERGPGYSVPHNSSCVFDVTRYITTMSLLCVYISTISLLCVYWYTVVHHDQLIIAITHASSNNSYHCYFIGSAVHKAVTCIIAELHCKC